MKVKSVNTVLNYNNTLDRTDLKKILSRIEDSIVSMEHPKHTGSFTLYGEKKLTGSNL